MKVKCSDCLWIGDSSEYLESCPGCREVCDVRTCCSVPGCDEVATGGTYTDGEYPYLCNGHTK